MCAERTPQVLDRRLALDIARVSERAAVAAAHLRGRGDEEAAETAAVKAAHRELVRMDISGRVVIGEDTDGAAGPLHVGETLGEGKDAVDIAVVALEGTTLCAKGMEGSISVVVLAEAGTLLKTPPVYMEKLAIGPGYPEGIVSLNETPGANIAALAEAKGVPPGDITALILDRPRHAGLIEAVRAAGAAVKLITDGDLAGIILAADPEKSGIDIYLGSGGADEGIMAAAALRCIGGQMFGRLMLDNERARAAANRMGIRDHDKIYRLTDMVRGDCLLAATGVTDSPLVKGVRFRRHAVETDTIIMRGATGTVRRIRAEHRDLRKFHIAQD